MAPVLMALLLLALAASCGGDDDGGGEVALPDAAETMTVTSPAFADGATIPETFTCDGDDTSPAVEWTGVPDGTVEIAVLVDDPDAPGGTFVHWVVWGIDAATTGLPEGGVPEGAVEGTNGFGETGWSGPCPPEGSGAHHYRFTVMALADRLDIEAGATADEVVDAVGGDALAQGRLTGLYER